MVVGHGDSEDLYGWKEVLDSLGLGPEDLPPEFLSKIGDDSTALDLPAKEDEDPTKTMPVEVPAWLEDGDLANLNPTYDDDDPEIEHTEPEIEQHVVYGSAYDDAMLQEEVTHEGIPHNAEIRKFVPEKDDADSEEDDYDDEPLPTRDSLLKPRKRAALNSDDPTKDYIVPSSSSPDSNYDDEPLPTRGFPPSSHARGLL